MPRKSVKSTTRTPGPDWFLPEWMSTLRVSQARLGKETGWSKATVNDIYHGRTEYYRAIVNAVSSALKIEPFELLMHPDEAMSLRRIQETALHIAAESRTPFRAREDEAAGDKRQTG